MSTAFRFSQISIAYILMLAFCHSPASSHRSSQFPSSFFKLTQVVYISTYEHKGEPFVGHQRDTCSAKLDLLQRNEIAEKNNEYTLAIMSLKDPLFVLS